MKRVLGMDAYRDACVAQVNALLGQPADANLSPKAHGKRALEVIDDAMLSPEEVGILAEYVVRVLALQLLAPKDVVDVPIDDQCKKMQKKYVRKIDNAISRPAS